MKKQKKIISEFTNKIVDLKILNKETLEDNYK